MSSHKISWRNHTISHTLFTRFLEYFKIRTVKREERGGSMFFLEESGFCRNIVIHSTMEIEMILRNICKECYIILYTVISIIIYPMTRSLEYQMSDSERTCFSESLPECKGTIHSHLWSIFIYIISHPELCCRDETDFFSVILECFCDESTSGSLTFCSRNTDNIHVFCRITWKCKSHDTSYKVVGYS